MGPVITKEIQRRISAYASPTEPEQLTLEKLIQEKLIPEDLPWTPTVCLKVPGKIILVHLLETDQLPGYVLGAIGRLRSAGVENVDVVITATTVETGPDRSVLRGAWAAGNVAGLCVKEGMGLGFIENKKFTLVFPPGYSLPNACANAEETGHIPSWIYEKLTAVEGFSPHLKKVFVNFAKTYKKLTRGRTLAYDKEVDLLRKLARNIAEGDARLFIPIGQLDVLREWERAGANKKSRDHFFHTFNNLLMGFFILGSLKRPTDKEIGIVDEHIRKQRGAQPALAPWEALWLLTCLFHDPAYIAENFHSGTFRFSYGVVEDESDFGAEIQEAQKDKIVDLWETEFVRARQLIAQLYDHTIRRWSAAMTGPAPSEFDAALGKAYFDGKQCSHSLISGIRLIQLCRTDRAVDEKRKPEPALTACVVAALGMMFHDEKCRNTLRKAGVQPFTFSKLPYASVLMFVDSLQDDRRDISKARFPIHGILQDLDVDSASRTVKATVCLPELPIKFWSGRIAEYENVLEWVNWNPLTDVKFSIDYSSKAQLKFSQSSGQHLTCL